MRIKLQVLEQNLEDSRTSAQTLTDDARTGSSALLALLKQQLADAETRNRQLRT